MLRTAFDPAFTTVDVPAFSRQHIIGLATGSLAAVRVPGFMGRAARGAVLGALHRLPTVEYHPARVAMTRFGPALNDYRTPAAGLDTDRYWRDAGIARRQWREAAMDPDPTAVSLDSLGKAWGRRPVPAAIGGRPAFAGMLREINAGTLLHYDDIHLEYPGGLFDQRVVAQLTYNVYPVVPERGGGTSLWRHRHEPADDTHRQKYGYSHDVVEGCPQITVVPRPGDALLFNPNNYHTVRPGDPGRGRRIALSFFLGLTATDDLVVWS